jgi:hypothetical protein
LLVDMLRHVETLGCTIKVEVAFRFHIPPFSTCGLTSELVACPIKSGVSLRRFEGMASQRTALAGGRVDT